MAEVRLVAARRDGTGKGPARRARAAGKVPAVLYGRGMEAVALEVNGRELVTAFHTDAGMNVLLDLEIDGQTTLALTKELQRDPVRGTLLHADFVKVDRTHAVEVEVPIHLVGESPGAKEGGVLEQPLFQLHVRCLPTDVPDAIEADISRLGTGDSLRVADLASGRGFEILTDPETVVAAVAAPVSAEELEAMEAAVTAEAPEAAELEGQARAEEASAETTEESADERGGDAAVP
jgi:large subunit ribosomal protein L25